MCGIVGVILPGEAAASILAGLSRVEYRGYDSAGIALIQETSSRIFCAREVGPVSNLEEQHLTFPPARVGIGHTRWATHGRVSVENAHPHLSQDGTVALVHNGVIDNADDIRRELEAEGVRFSSDTDTEVIVHLIARSYSGCPEAAVADSILRLRGTFGIVVAFGRHPDILVAARLGSPLIVGLGDELAVVASDPQAIVAHTRKVVYMQDEELAVIRAGSVSVRNFNREPVPTTPELLSSQYKAASKDGYEHFLLKEIFDQPESLERAIAGRLQLSAGSAGLGGLNLTDSELTRFNSVTAVGCGTGYHAAMIIALAMKHIAKLRAWSEVACQMMSGTIVADANCLYLALSQSGETADLLSVVRELKQKGSTVAGLINVVGSTLARMCGRGVYVHAGTEVSVASTKAYANQVVCGLMLALKIGRSGVIARDEGQAIAAEIARIPSAVRQYLASPGPVEPVARELVSAPYVMFMGRGFSYPVALEGALKFKELCYVPSEGFDAGEMKHGAIAMIEPGTPVVSIIPRDSQRTRAITNTLEAKARGARIVAVHQEGDSEVASLCDYSIPVPALAEYAAPVVNTIPLQLISYHAAVAVGANVDRPRNLAKSVTVE